MLTTFKPLPYPQISLLPKPISLLPKLPHLSFPLKPSLSRFHLFAQTNNFNQNQTPKQEEINSGNGGDNGSDGEGKKNGKPLLKIKWRELLFDPDPDNLVAVGLSGLLTWASVQVLWQLLIISLAILVAALKYSFIAALLLFILITLL